MTALSAFALAGSWSRTLGSIEIHMSNLLHGGSQQRRPGRPGPASANAGEEVPRAGSSKGEQGSQARDSWRCAGGVWCNGTGTGHVGQTGGQESGEASAPRARQCLRIVAMPLQAKIILFFQANKLAGRQAEQIGAGQVRLRQRVAPRKHGHTDRSARDALDALRVSMCVWGVGVNCGALAKCSKGRAV